jgi:hypothetical protein
MAIKAEDIDHVNIHKRTQINKQNNKSSSQYKTLLHAIQSKSMIQSDRVTKIKNIKIKSTEQVTIKLSYMYKLHKLKNKTHHNIAHKEARIKTSNKKLYKPLQSLATTAQLKTSAHHRLTTALHRRYKPQNLVRWMWLTNFYLCPCA